MRTIILSLLFTLSGSALFAAAVSGPARSASTFESAAGAVDGRYALSASSQAIDFSSMPVRGFFLIVF